MKTVRHFRLVLSFLLALGAASAWAEPASSDPSSPAKVVWRLDAGFSGAWVPSWEEERPFLSAAGIGFDTGIEAALGGWIIGRGSLGFLSVGGSEFDESLWHYRAFWSMRLSAETGFRFMAGQVELGLLTGGAISASKYTATSLVTAYYSLTTEPYVLVPIHVRGINVDGLCISASIPCEYLFRGAARSLALGIEAGVNIPLGKKAGR